MAHAGGVAADIKPNNGFTTWRKGPVEGFCWSRYSPGVEVNPPGTVAALAVLVVIPRSMAWPRCLRQVLAQLSLAWLRNGRDQGIKRYPSWDKDRP